MGDVLVRKSISIQQQIGEPPSVFVDPFGSGNKGNSVPLRNPTGLQRTPRAAAAAMQAGAQAEGDLARLPRTGSLPADEREQNRIDRATMQDAIDTAKPRSLQEQVAVRTFNRLQDDYEKYHPDLVDRAAERAGKVGVLGARAGKFAGGALGVLAGATALSDASAAGQDFTTGLMGAGLTGASTYAQTAPTLGKYGARVGGRIGVRNQLRDEMKDAQFAAKQPVAVAPPTASPTASPVATPTDRNFQQGRSIFIGGAGQGRQERYPNTQLSDDQLRARLDNINTSGYYGGGLTPNQQMEATHLTRRLNPTTAGQPFNPQVQPDGMSMFNFTHPGGQQTITGLTPSVPSSIFKPAEPTLPVAVQSNLNPAGAANVLTKPAEGSVENMNMQGTTGAADKVSNDFMRSGMGSMAGASSAGQQKLTEEEEEEQ